MRKENQTGRTSREAPRASRRHLAKARTAPQFRRERAMPRQASEKPPPTATAAQAARPASRNGSEEIMIRRLSFGFVVVIITAFIVAACGRQVTPNPPGLGPGGAPPGYIAIHFDVAGPIQLLQLPVHDRLQHDGQPSDAVDRYLANELGRLFVCPDRAGHRRAASMPSRCSSCATKIRTFRRHG